MRRPLVSHTVAVGAVLALVVTAPAALASFASSVSAGPMTVSSASLAAPSAAAASNNPPTCQKNKSATLTVNVTWTASSSAWATGYSIIRSTTSGGPYTQVGTVTGPNSTSWTDTTGTLNFATTYYYVVQATYLTWTSPNSNETTIATLNHLCA